LFKKKCGRRITKYFDLFDRARNVLVEQNSAPSVQFLSEYSALPHIGFFPRLPLMPPTFADSGAVVQLLAKDFEASCPMNAGASPVLAGKIKT
jgi:hypothetical protein